MSWISIGDGLTEHGKSNNFFVTTNGTGVCKMSNIIVILQVNQCQLKPTVGLNIVLFEMNTHHCITGKGWRKHNTCIKGRTSIQVGSNEMKHNQGC